ncbi:MAG TPA: N-acetylmuramoyl-L-alanine amidase [Candidatus Paceibacterota bacterium]|nr:N-acetylmuramoyl-L-alanine amidase [Candidatus Paceibacterota bacterium]
MKRVKIIFLFSLIAFFAAGSSVFAAAMPAARILIVPGHDSEYPGASFRGVKEEDMNVKLGNFLYKLLKEDKRFLVFITRDDWFGYTKEFSGYFKNNEEKIKKFISNSKTVFQDQIENGDIIAHEGVNHNSVSDEMAIKLYGINLWADENKMDAVIHVHFNDYSRRFKSERGVYKGFAVYSPEQHLKNNQKSFELAGFIFSSLLKRYPKSNYEKESSGIVPDQKLIALGSHNTLGTRSLLIEYGYIYEKRFSTFAKREAEMKVMARATRDGLREYFDYLSKHPL